MLTFLALGFSFFTTELILTYISGSFSLADMYLEMTPSAWLFGILLAGVTVFLAGWYPSFVLSKLSPKRTLMAQKSLNVNRRFNLRQVLVFAQFSIVYLLVIGAMVVGQQMDYLRSVDKGFEQNAILTINIPGGDYPKLNQLRSEILAHPNIDNMSYATGIPMTDTESTYGTDYHLPHETEEQGRLAEMKVVDLNYLDLYDLKMIAGKWLTQANADARFFNGFIANEALVEKLGMTPEEVIGQQLFINEGDARIIGVVENFNNNPMQEAVSPCLIFHYGTGFFNEAGIKLNSNQNISETLAHIEEKWAETYPTSIFKYQFIDETFEKYYRIESFIYGAFQIFSMLAILIGCIGLYGLMSFIAESRTREIGVRKVLGATIGNIILLLSKDFGKLTFFAILLSAPFAWYFLSQWLNAFAYRIELNIGVFLVGALLSLAIPMLTVGWQSLQAALMNPVDSLRND